jgi:hypothetical protein
MFHEAARRFQNEAFETFSSKRIRSMPRKKACILMDKRSGSTL